MYGAAKLEVTSDFFPQNKRTGRNAQTIKPATTGECIYGDQKAAEVSKMSDDRKPLVTKSI